MGEAAQAITDAVADVIGHRAAGNGSPAGSWTTISRTSHALTKALQAVDQRRCEARPEGFEPPTF